MKHVACVNYINLDCEKGMCALSKQIIPIDGEGSDERKLDVFQLWCFLLRAL